MDTAADVISLLFCSVIVGLQRQWGFFWSIRIRPAVCRAVDAHYFHQSRKKVRCLTFAFFSFTIAFCCSDEVPYLHCKLDGSILLLDDQYKKLSFKCHFICAELCKTSMAQVLLIEAVKIDPWSIFSVILMLKIALAFDELFHLISDDGTNVTKACSYVVRHSVNGL